MLADVRTKSLCKNGHPLTPENVNKARNCKICQRDKVRKFMQENRGKYREQEQARNRGYCERLTDSYINVLIHAKTGIPYEEITDQDRDERRQIVTAYRQRKADRLMDNKGGINAVSHPEN